MPDVNVKSKAFLIYLNREKLIPKYLNIKYQGV
ncbi:hypothetical protein ES708_06246 [subsurface metagenome]